MNWMNKGLADNIVNEFIHDIAKNLTYPV